MNSFYCYIHLAGRWTPELRTFEAETPSDLPDMILSKLTDWPPMEQIELIEICTDENELIAKIRPGETHSTSN